MSKSPINQILELTVYIILFIIFYKGDSELMIGALTILILISINDILKKKKKQLYVICEGDINAEDIVISAWDDSKKASQELNRIIEERKRYTEEDSYYDEEEEPFIFSVYLNDSKDEYGNMKRMNFYTRLKEEIKDIKSLFIKIKNKKS